MFRHYRHTAIFVLFFNFLHVQSQGVIANQFVRNDAESIAQQLGFGIKRALFYMNTLIDKCDNIGDINQWLMFMISYFKCDAEAYPNKLKSTTTSLNEKDSIDRLNELCAAWPKRSKCSSRLASKLDSCLSSQLEDGRAGTNALRLAYAQMEFICRYKNEYIQNIDSSKDVAGDHVPVEKQPLACFNAIKEPMKKCISDGDNIMLKPQKSTFCGNFNLAKNCLTKTAMEVCKDENASNFLFKKLEHIQVELQCSSMNEI